MKKNHSGFTLFELLVTLAIVAVLGGIGLTCLNSVKEKSRILVEVNAARNMITGYLGHAAENNGSVLAGYQTDPTATNLQGVLLEFPINARYPWRLARSVPSVAGVLVFNGSEAMLEEANADYLVSTKPNLGLNATLVGGHFGSGSPLAPSPRLVDAYGKFYLTHLIDSDDPSRLIVFASARSAENQPGYFEVRPPHLTSRIWELKKFSKDAPASAHGYTDFRWGGKAVAAMLGGNVELLDEVKLRDMRRWSHQAARANDANFMISKVR